MFTKGKNLLCFGVACLASLAAASRPSTEELQNRLRLASSAAQRNRILDKDDDYIFNFVHPPAFEGIAVGKGGRTVTANGATFPALIGTGSAMTLGFLGPCGLNTPHVHPRATEFNMVVAGTALRTGVIPENGARFVLNEVPVGSASIFPKGAIHFEQNLGCEPAIFVAGFNHEDPGTLQIADRFSEIHKGTLQASLGGLDIQILDNLEIPANVALGTQDCLDRCRIDRETFNYTGSFPFNWNATAALLADSPLTTNPGARAAAGGSLAGSAGGDGASETASIPFSENPLRFAVIGLATTCGVLLLGLAAAVFRLYKTSRQKKGYARPLTLAGDYDRSESTVFSEKAYNEPYVPYADRAGAKSPLPVRSHST